MNNNILYCLLIQLPNPRGVGFYGTPIKKATEYKDADLLNAIENLAKRYAKQTYHYSDGELVPTSLTHYTSTSTSATVSPDYAYHYSLS